MMPRMAPSGNTSDCVEVIVVDGAEDLAVPDEPVKDVPEQSRAVESCLKLCESDALRTALRANGLQNDRPCRSGRRTRSCRGPGDLGGDHQLAQPTLPLKDGWRNKSDQRPFAEFHVHVFIRNPVTTAHLSPDRGKRGVRSQVHSEHLMRITIPQIDSNLYDNLLVWLLPLFNDFRHKSFGDKWPNCLERRASGEIGIGRRQACCFEERRP